MLPLHSNMNLLGEPKEEIIQLYFRDDGGFLFRKLPVENSLLQEKKNNVCKVAWMMPYKLLKKFEGHKSFPHGKVLICYGRDILMDPFDQLSDKEKPERGRSLIKSYVSDIANATIYKHEAAPKKTIMDKMVLYMGITMVVFGLAIAAMAAT